MKTTQISQLEGGSADVSAAVIDGPCIEPSLALRTDRMVACKAKEHDPVRVDVLACGFGKDAHNPSIKFGTVNFARFDLVSIRLAVLCFELGSLSAAAKRAHCSLSTSSYRLNSLEEALGKQLFVRDHCGLRATEAGELFLQHATVILDLVASMSERVRSVASVDRPPPPQPATGVGPDQFARFGQRA